MSGKNEKTKKIIESTFNEVSNKYDKNAFFKLTAQKMATSFTSNHDFKLLDVSTGTGIVVFEVLEKHPNINITAVDISQGMLEVAQDKAEKLGYTQINFSKQDVEKLKYKNECFDIITCGFGLFFYPNMQDTFNSLCKMIKKEGKFIFSSFTQEAFEPYSSLFFESLEQMYNIEAPKRTITLLDTKKEIQTLVQNYKPFDFKIEEVQISYLITVDDWWQLLNSAGYKALLNQLDEKQLLKFKEIHLNDMAKLSDNGNITLNVNTLVTSVIC